jgi:hypothetical protein
VVRPHPLRAAFHVAGTKRQISTTSREDAKQDQNRRPNAPIKTLTPLIADFINIIDPQPTSEANEARSRMRYFFILREFLGL